VGEVELPLKVQRFLRREGLALPGGGVTEADVLAAVLVELRAIKQLLQRQAESRSALAVGALDRVASASKRANP
jgi:hypothetical protein